VFLQVCELQNQQPHQGKKPDRTPRTVPREVGRPGGLIHSDDSQIDRSSSSSRHESRIVVNVTRADRRQLEAIISDRSAPQKNTCGAPPSSWRRPMATAPPRSCADLPGGTTAIALRFGAVSSCQDLKAVPAAIVTASATLVAHTSQPTASFACPLGFLIADPFHQTLRCGPVRREKGQRSDVFLPFAISNGVSLQECEHADGYFVLESSTGNPKIRLMSSDLPSRTALGSSAPPRH
jgi:hypothetical protein